MRDLSMASWDVSETTGRRGLNAADFLDSRDYNKKSLYKRMFEFYGNI